MITDSAAAESPTSGKTAGRLDSWAFAAVQSTGALHQRDGTPCQDSWAAASTPDGACWIAAVADGAGSVSQAAAGSAAAAGAAVETLCKCLPLGDATDAAWLEALGTAVAAARAALVRAAAQSGGDPSALHQFATTLLLAAIAPTADGDRLAATAIGDGAIVLSADGQLSCVAVCERGEFANEAYFLTDPDAESHRASYTAVLPRLSGLALLTDGVEPLSVSGRGTKPYPPFFTSLFAHVASGGPADAIATVLESPVAQRKSFDDKTLVIIARPSAHTGTTA